MCSVFLDFENLEPYFMTNNLTFWSILVRSKFHSYEESSVQVHAFRFQVVTLGQGPLVKSERDEIKTFDGFWARSTVPYDTSGMEVQPVFLLVPEIESNVESNVGYFD